jgi:phage head maturation protease
MNHNGTLRIAGYAALFDIADGARDTIRPGAFARTLGEQRAPLPLYWQHRPEQRIGTVETIAEDARGVRVIARIVNPASRAVQALLRREVSGLSFAAARAGCGNGRMASTHRSTKSAKPTSSGLARSTSRGSAGSLAPRR